ncbi:peptidylprolyl isomerase [Campylobacter sp. MOP7]|uniref:FKBP-type peptidyl-prolyl cis-trans isomerase n=1 Tax=Campylobacter canis TaxID=3378588 RepID=UPI00387E7CD4
MKDQVISMFYELKDAKTGEILESNMQTGSQISFLTGRGHIIPKLEEEVSALKAGDRKNIVIEAAEACGLYDEKALQTLPKEQFAGIELKEGMELFGQGEDGSNVRVIVSKIGEDDVTVDFNHPYAGKDLEFNVEVTEVRDATEDEIATGVVAQAHACGCGSHGKKSGGCCGGGHHDHDHGEGGCCGGHGHHHEDDECCGGAHHDEHGGGCCGKHH